MELPLLFALLVASFTKRDTLPTLQGAGLEWQMTRTRECWVPTFCHCNWPQ